MKQPQPQNEISIVAVGDLHCGSRSAICVPDMQLCEGGSFRHSSAQRALYEAWDGISKEWGKPDILVVNGDAIEGQARKESGVPCWSTDLDDQLNCAEQLINKWKAGKTYIIDGTGYHVDAGGKSCESHLGMKIKAEKIGVGGQHSADELFLRVREHTWHFAHHIGVGTGWYKTTPMAREMVFALLNESHKHRCDYIVRSHVHYFCHVEFTRQHGHILPCWQLQTRYMRKKSVFGMLPDIGVVRWLIRGDHVKFEKRFFRPIEFKPKLFIYEENEN